MLTNGLYIVKNGKKLINHYFLNIYNVKKCNVIFRIILYEIIVQM
jgi:hypothetical protein